MKGSWSVPPEELNSLLDKMGLVGEILTGRTQVLELGFGDGKLLVEIAKRGASAVGCDISEEAMRMAWAKRRTLPQELIDLISIYRCPMEDLVFDDQTFDFVISYGSIEHALSIEGAVSEVHRVLRKGGIFLLYAPNEEWIHVDQPLETTMTAEEWKDILTAHSLVLDSAEKVGDNTILIGHRPSIAAPSRLESQSDEGDRA